MKYIELTQGKQAVVDDEDFEWLSQWKWHAVKSSRTYYAKRRNSIKRLVFMHRAILLTASELVSDHINGNGLDNRRSNLRECSLQQNYWNAKPRKGTSKFKGVSWHKKSKRWCVQITINGKPKHVGLFRSETKAAICYNETALKHYGEFAWLNKI